MIYLLNLMIVPFYYFIIRTQSANKESAKTLFFWVIFLHAILFRALANPYNYQEDTKLYAEAFQSISEMSFYETVFTLHFYTHWGQLYLALNWILGCFSSDPTILFVVVSILTVGMTLWFYYKTSYSFLLTVLIYLMYPMMYIMGFGVLRQHLSIAIVLVALLNWNNLKMMIVLFLVASLFHTSALILFPFLIIRRLNFHRIKLTSLCIYLLIGFIILKTLIVLALPYFTKYQEIVNEGESTNNIIPVVLIGSLIVMYYITGTLSKISSDRDVLLFRFLVYGLVVSLFSIGVPGAGRLSLVFVYIIPTAISFLYRYGGKKMIPINNLYTMLFFILTIVLLYYANNSTESHYLRYSFFWEN